MKVYRFQNGQEDVEDDLRLVSPFTSKTDEKIRNLVRFDCQLSIWVIA